MDKVTEILTHLLQQNKQTRKKKMQQDIDNCNIINERELIDSRERERDTQQLQNTVLGIFAKLTISEP